MVLFFSLVFLQNARQKKVEALQQKYSPIEDRNIREASGLVKSKLNSKSAGKVFWTHNDSGDRARVLPLASQEKTTTQSRRRKHGRRGDHFERQEQGLGRFGTVARS